MRDPARIRPTLDAIAEVWSRHPDLRLGQLLLAACEYAGRRRSDLAHIEDADLLRGLARLDAEMGPPVPPPDPLARAVTEGRQDAASYMARVRKMWGPGEG